MKIGKIRNVLLVTILFIFLSSSTVNAAILKLYPATDSFAKGDSFTVDVVLDTEEEEVMATDAIIDYDDQKLEATSAYLLDVFSAKVADGTIKNGQIIFSANDINAVSGVKTFAKISFKTLVDSGVANVNFVFNSGDSYDSLVAKAGGVKVLNSVENGVYTIGNGIGGETTTTTTSYSNTYTTPSPKPVVYKPVLPKAGNEMLTLLLIFLGAGLLTLGIRTKLN